MPQVLLGFWNFYWLYICFPCAALFVDSPNNRANILGVRRVIIKGFCDFISPGSLGRSGSCTANALIFKLYFAGGYSSDEDTYHI